MTTDDARLFVSYRKHQDLFNFLVDKGVFDTKGGSVVLHFNASGRIMKIDKQEVLFYLSVK